MRFRNFLISFALHVIVVAGVMTVKPELRPVIIERIIPVEFLPARPPEAPKEEPPKQEPEKPKPKPIAPDKPRRARIQPRASAPPPADFAPVEALPIPASPMQPPDLEITDLFIRDPIPKYRKECDYPDRAMRRNREGRVEIEFTIRKDGSVGDVTIISADPPGWFERETLRCFLRWKYDPMIVNGEPVDVPSRRAVINFRLES